MMRFLKQVAISFVILAALWCLTESIAWVFELKDGHHIRTILGFCLIGKYASNLAETVLIMGEQYTNIVEREVTRTKDETVE